MHVLFIVTFGLILSSCGGGSSSGGSSGGGGGTLTVTMPVPGNGATNVSLTPLIQLNTSLPVATVPSNSVVLRQGGSIVNTTTTVSGNVITVTVVGSLQANTQYQLSVTNQLVSTSGVAATPATFSFTTSASATFVVSVLSPASGAGVSALSSQIQLQAGSAFLSAANVLANVQVAKGGVSVTLPTPVLSNNNTTATFTLTNLLASSSTYTITIIGGSSGIQSAAQTTMAGNVTSTFNTNPLAFTFSTGALNMDMAMSGDGINWMVDMLATSFMQFIPSGTNVLMLGNRGAVSTPSASLFSSYQIQKFPTATNQIINQYATNGSGTIVGVGGTAGTGIVVYSTNNGVSWNQLTLSATQTIMQVSFGNGIFVALDNAGNAYNSANGISWSGATATGLGAGATLPNMAFANGFFVAVTSAATGINFSSANGTTWTAGTATAVASTSLVYGTISGINYWVIGQSTGAIAYQVVATNTAPTGAWTQVATVTGANAVTKMIIANNLLVYGVNTTGQIAYSSGTGGAPTAVTAVATTPLGVTNVNGLAFGGTNGTTFVAVGNNGNIAVSTTSIATWAAATITLPTPLQGSVLAAAGLNVQTGVIYLGNNTFITGGANSVVLTSTNGGTTWTYPANPPSTPGNAITSGNLTINGVVTPVQITVGNTGSIYYSTNNGSTWTAATSNTIQNLNAVACGIENGIGICVAVGAAGTVIYSTNASTWTVATSGTAQALNAIAFGNGAFVAVGAAGAITSSLNGTTWSATTVSANAYNAITYGLNGSTPTFVAVGAAGQISYNITSTASSIGTFVSVTVSASAYGAVSSGTVNGIFNFIAVGVAGQVSRSLDGVNWTSITVGAGVNNSVTNSPTLWMISSAAGGASTSIYTSPDGLNYTAVTLPATATVSAANYFAGYANPFVITTTLGTGVYATANPSNTSSWTNYLGLQGLVFNKLIGI